MSGVVPYTPPSYQGLQPSFYQPQQGGNGEGAFRVAPEKSLGFVLGEQGAHVFRWLGQWLSDLDRTITSFVTFPGASAEVVQQCTGSCQLEDPIAVYVGTDHNHEGQMKAIKGANLPSHAQTALFGRAAMVQHTRTVLLNSLQELATVYRATKEDLDQHCESYSKLELHLEEIVDGLKQSSAKQSSAYYPSTYNVVALSLPKISDKGEIVRNATLETNGIPYASIHKLNPDLTWCNSEEILDQSMIKEVVAIFKLIYDGVGDAPSDFDKIVQYYSDNNLEEIKKLRTYWETHSKELIQKIKKNAFDKVVKAALDTITNPDGTKIVGIKTRILGLVEQIRVKQMSYLGELGIPNQLIPSHDGYSWSVKTKRPWYDPFTNSYDLVNGRVLFSFTTEN